MTMMQKKCNQYGRWAFARHCAKLGISFDECYRTIFGRYPA